VELPALGESVTPLVVQVPREAFGGRFEMTVVVRDEAGSFAVERRVEFIGPDAPEGTAR
jgi:hypothetical protein